MAVATDALISPSALGARVKALREAMSLSLRDLAERSGVSAPMLSQVERGETSPTLQVAGRIAAGLDLRLSQLLRLDEDGAVSIVRRGERRKGPGGGRGHGGHLYEILTPPLPGQRAELSRHTLAPGAVTGGPGDPPMHEPGSRETALVESGAVVLVCDGEAHHLFTARPDGNGHFADRRPLQPCFVQRQCLALHGNSLASEQLLMETVPETSHD